MRVCRVARSDSLKSAMPFSVNDMLVKRHSVLATSVGASLNGAVTDMTLSRNGTLFFRSPPSSASVHKTVAG